jgi:hypothetical protein
VNVWDAEDGLRLRTAYIWDHAVLYPNGVVPLPIKSVISQ